MPEITDDEYNRLLGKAQVADLSESLWNDPQLGKYAKGLVKTKFPHVNIPDYDIETRFNARLDADKREREEAKAAERDAAERERYKKIRDDVQKEYGFTEDGMKDLEKLMVAKNVGDYEVAATYHAVKNPKQSDATYHDGFWHHQNQEGFAEISKDPEAWARKEILGALRRDEEKMKGWR